MVTVKPKRIRNSAYPANRSFHIFDQGGEDSLLAEPIVDAYHCETPFSEESR
jgi:hypothetical protein